jgi:long-chain fatty acid transport protein
MNWPAGWEGRTQITYSNLTTYEVNPTVAYHIGRFRFGAGLQGFYGTLDVKQDLATPGGLFGTSELGGDAWGAGANVGAQFDVVPKVFSLGVHYRSAVALPFDDASVHFGNVPPSLTGALHDQPAQTRFVLPETVAFGGAIHPTKHLTLGLDGVWTGWSRVQAVNITFPNDPTGSLSASSSRIKNWSDVVSVHFGAEYALDQAWRLRGGFIFDPSPQPPETLTPDIPDASRLNFAIGGGYRHKSGVSIDVAYELIVLLHATSTAPALPGEYSGYANILGFTLGYASKTPH